MMAPGYARPSAPLGRRQHPRLRIDGGQPVQRDHVSPFHGPSPPFGSHRYGLFVFYQPNGIINYTALTTPIINWNYSTFIQSHSLGTPMYANWHVTLHSE